MTDILCKENKLFNKDSELSPDFRAEIENARKHLNNHYSFCEAAPASKVFDSRVGKQCGPVSSKVVVTEQTDKDLRFPGKPNLR